MEVSLIGELDAQEEEEELTKDAPSLTEWLGFWELDLEKEDMVANETVRYGNWER